jgi:hypothetical protein
MPHEREKVEWHLDKKVSIAVIIVLLSNTCAVTWWASGMEYRAMQSEREISFLKKRVDDYDVFQRSLMVELATIREKITAQVDTMKRIEIILEKKADRR